MTGLEDRIKSGMEGSCKAYINTSTHLLLLKKSVPCSSRGGHAIEGEVRSLWREAVSPACHTQSILDTSLENLLSQNSLGRLNFVSRKCRRPYIHGHVKTSDKQVRDRPAGTSSLQSGKAPGKPSGKLRSNFDRTATFLPRKSQGKFERKIVWVLYRYNCS